MSKKSLLFITEGKVDEPDFIKKFLEVCIPNVEYNIYSYSTTIHTLAKTIFNRKGKIDKDLAIKRVLREQEKDITKREVLSNDYTDVVLVFDFEPRCDSPEFDKVEKMIEYFNDSSNMGRLYINYPMMQSYKHFKRFPDEEFKDRKIETIDVTNYKEIVHKESQYKKLVDYNYPICLNIIGYHLMKANYIISNRYSLMDRDEFFSLDYKKIYNIERENNEKYGYVDVLNTFALFIIEFNPTDMIEKIKKFIL